MAQADSTTQSSTAVKIPTLTRSISIKPSAARPTASIPSEVKELTQEILENYWREVYEASDDAKLRLLMENKSLELREHGLFYIIADNSLFETEFKPYLVQVLQQLRHKTQMPLLNCKVIVHLPEKQAMLYNANEKYAELLRRNPNLANMRELFQEIDI